MSGLAGCLASLALLAAGDVTAVVSIGEPRDVAPVVRALHPAPVLSAEVLAERLTGSPAPRTPDLGGVRRLIEAARAAEATFRDTEALDLRMRVLDAFEAAPRPVAELRELATTAAVEIAAGLQAAGEREAAAEMAAEAVAHYLDTELDRVRYSPKVRALFDESMAAGELVPLVVRCDRPGRVLADGRYLGLCGDQLEVKMPPGSYRVWLDRRGALSLPRVVELAGAGAEVLIDSARDARLDIDSEGGGVVVRCDVESCAEDLAELGRRLDVSTVHGVGAEHRGALRVVRVDVASGARVDSWLDASGAWGGPPAEPLPAFTPLYLVPFGGGQFAQERYVLGGVYLTAQAGLLAWTIGQAAALATNRHRQRRRELQTLAGVSGGVLAGALVAGVVEAVIVGAVVGE